MFKATEKKYANRKNKKDQCHDEFHVMVTIIYTVVYDPPPQNVTCSVQLFMLYFLWSSSELKVNNTASFQDS